MATDATMGKILTRVEALIALAASDNENEARNAAFEACKLIREHKLVLRGAAEAPPEPLVAAAAATAPPPRDDPYRRGIRVRVVTSPRAVNRKASWTAMRSLHSSHCQSCLTRIDVGEFVYWAKDEGSVHLACFAEYGRT